jgi:protein NDRG1
LDALTISYVIGLGEGAGANILARFGMDYPQRSLGLILIHCTSTVAGVMEYFRDKVKFIFCSRLRSSLVGLVIIST